MIFPGPTLSPTLRGVSPHHHTTIPSLRGWTLYIYVHNILSTSTSHSSSSSNSSNSWSLHHEPPPRAFHIDRASNTIVPTRNTNIDSSDTVAHETRPQISHLSCSYSCSCHCHCSIATSNDLATLIRVSMSTWTARRHSSTATRDSIGIPSNIDISRSITSAASTISFTIPIKRYTLR